MFGLSRFSHEYGSMHCPQLLLNGLQDFNNTWWIFRLHNGDVHVVRNFIFDNFCRRYGYLDLVIFHTNMGQCVVRNSSETNCRISVKLGGLLEYIMEMCM